MRARLVILAFFLSLPLHAEPISQCLPLGSDQENWLSLVSQYESSYSMRLNFDRLRLQTRIKRGVFESSNSTEYRARLAAINEMAERNPMAASDLARVLELEWIARSAPAPIRDHAQREAWAKGGQIVGISALGGAVVAQMVLATARAPWKIPATFLILKPLLPLAGTASGFALGDALNPSGQSSDDSTAPSSLLELGAKIPSPQDLEAERKLLLELVPSTVGVTAASIAYELGVSPRAAQVITLSARASVPVFLLASFAAGLTAEAGAETRNAAARLGRARKRV